MPRDERRIKTDLTPPAGRQVVVAIGEALFDCFSDRLVLGGAPVNFIVSLQHLLNVVGGQGQLVSRIGDDRLGRRLIEELAVRTIPTDFVQIDRARPTGQVNVNTSPAGSPDYEIAENVAWDHITFEEPLETLAASCSAVCFGTLAQRSATSYATIQRFLTAASQAIRVLDVNLRQHYFTPEILETSLRAANVVKLNEDELCRVSQMLAGRLSTALTLDERACALLQQFDLQLLALTRGARGTVLYTNDGRIEGKAVAISASALADEVGAGDACCAGIVYGLLMRWPLQRTVDLANRMGAHVASQPGGTPSLPRELLDFAGAPNAL